MRIGWRLPRLGCLDALPKVLIKGGKASEDSNDDDDDDGARHTLIGNSIALS